jgi:hypothetical protein
MMRVLSQLSDDPEYKENGQKCNNPIPLSYALYRYGLLLNRLLASDWSLSFLIPGSGSSFITMGHKGALFNKSTWVHAFHGSSSIGAKIMPR